MIPETKLSKITAGFQNLVDEIQNRFADEYPWQDKLNSSLNTFLVDLLAGLTVNANTRTDIAQLESLLLTARRDSSIYAISRMLGVKLNRRTSAAVQVRLTNNSLQPVTIPPYAPFTIEGSQFFNRESVVINSRETVTISIYEGVVNTQEFDLVGRNLVMPEFFLNELDFRVSMNDMQVYTRTPGGEYTEWLEHIDSILELNSTSTRYIESTTAAGDTSILFGDGTYGQLLSQDDTLVIQYIITEGENANGITTGARVNYVDNNLVTGNTLETVMGGTFPKGAQFYKAFAPMVYQSRKTMVRPRDWRGNIMLYPGVADVVIQSQRDIAPNDPSWRNNVRVCVLPTNSATWGGSNPNPASAVWNEFKAWAQTLCGKHLTIQSYNPKKILVNLSIEVNVEEWVDLEEIKSIIRAAVIELFRRKPGRLGSRFSISDVIDVCKNDPETEKPRDGVDYVRILEPSQDIEPASKLEYITLNSLNIFAKYTER